MVVLEIAKLLVGVATPIVVVVLGLPIARSARRVEQAQWQSRKLIALRLGLYAEMAPALNDLLCFFRCVGDFQAITPPEALRRKRILDKAFHVNEYLMSEEFARHYRAFIDACFLPYTGAAQPAQLRASLTRQRAERTERDSEWDALLVPETVTPTSLAELSRLHGELMRCFAEQIGVRLRLPQEGEPHIRTPGPQGLPAPKRRTSRNH